METVRIGGNPSTINTSSRGYVEIRVNGFNKITVHMEYGVRQRLQNNAEAFEKEMLVVREKAIRRARVMVNSSVC